MTLYLDASVLLPLLTVDPHTERARALIGEFPQVVTSAWGEAEVTSALNRHTRIGRLTFGEALDAQLQFDEWIARLDRRP